MESLTQHIFQAITTLLLSTLTGIGVYFIRKVETLDRRVSAIETMNPKFEEELKAIEQLIDERTSQFNTKIEDFEKHLTDKIDSQYLHLLRLINNEESKE